MSLEKFPSGQVENSIKEEEFPPQQEPNKFRKAVYVSAFVAAIGGFVCGYDTGSISGIMAMPTFNDHFFDPDQVVYLQGLLLALYLMAAALGSFSSGVLCASCALCVGILLELIGVNFGILLAGRIVGGYGSGLMGNAIPLYHSEIAPPDIRGRLISFFTLMSTFGQVVGYFVTFGTSYVSNSNWCWRAPWLIQMVVVVAFGVSMTALPFSPRWLIDKKRYEEAKRVLADLHEVPECHFVVENEYDAIVSEIEYERSFGHRTYLELFKGGNLKRTLISIFIAISTSLTGSVAIGYYAPAIFQNAGLNDVSASIATTGGSSILAFIATGISLHYCIDKWGRKPVFLIGAAVMGVSMFVVGAMFHIYTIVDVENYAVTITNLGARSTIIAFIYIFTATYAFSWGIASYVYPAEIFNMRTRAKGLALTYGLNWGFSILISYCIPLFMAHTVSGVFFFFGACCVGCFIGCWFIPETKGRTLEEMESVFNKS
ncbi:general substrate transporter [Backusella circina FSU 941]|nr:general substrate transporter [Backusella circina FSU 941]